jgi:hypothetical protein
MVLGTPSAQPGVRRQGLVQAQRVHDVMAPQPVGVRLGAMQLARAGLRSDRRRHYAGGALDAECAQLDVNHQQPTLRVQQHPALARREPRAAP